MPSFSKLLAPTLTAMLWAWAPEALAQESNGLPTRAFAFNGGPLVGILGGGIYGRLNPEFQVHLGRGFQGHALNVGLAAVYWPNEGGPSACLAARYQYDHQLVRGTPFFVSPYVGLDAGLGIFNVADGGTVRYRGVLMPSAGLELKVVLARRLLLGFRPLGFTFPVFLGGTSSSGAFLYEYDVLYEVGATLGATF